MARMKKVLIITYYWPPAGGPGVQRILRFASYLPQFGWQPLILTVEEGDYPAIDESLLHKIPPECKTYKTAILEPYNIYRKFTGKAKDEKLPTFILSKTGKENFKDRAAKWIRGNIFIPDARIGWLPYAVKAGVKIIKEENVDLIFSSSPPHTVQLIAKRLARKTGKKWVADFRDPWTEAFWADDIQKTALSKYVDAKLETSVLKTANAVTTVSEGMGEMFASKAGNRYAVIQNGFEPLPPQSAKTEKFVLLFIGHLSKHQNPETIFQAITTLPDKIQKTIQVLFIGRIFEGFREIFEKYQAQIDIVTREYMPHRELLEFAQQNASLLLRPIARTAYSQSNVGAKTSDYLALRKPMLTLGEKGGFSERMLAETAAGQIFEYEDVEGIAAYIWENYRIWESEGCVILDNEEKLEKYTTRYNVGKLVELFESIKE